jgi:hypothetical protein
LDSAENATFSFQLAYANFAYIGKNQDLVFHLNLENDMDGACLCGCVTWQFDGVPEAATACNCTACRRYGVLWAYDYAGERIRVSGPTKAYVRGKALEFHFCPQCGCVAYWLGLRLEEDGRRRIAVNLRLSEPGPIAAVPIDHFDGLDTFDDLPRDGRCVGDYWF